jgi:hypothetical protein
MGSISNLSITDVVTASTRFAIDQNDIDVSVPVGAVVDYLESQIATGDAKVIQYAAPSATGFNVAVTNSSASVWLVLTPLTGYAAGTITLPAVENSVENQEVLVNCTASVGTLTVAGNGATVVGAPASLAANDFFRLRFEPVLKFWYRVG